MNYVLRLDVLRGRRTLLLTSSYVFFTYNGQQTQHASRYTTRPHKRSSGVVDEPYSLSTRPILAYHHFIYIHVTINRLTCLIRTQDACLNLVVAVGYLASVDGAKYSEMSTAD